MSNRTIMILVALAAILFWIGLVVLMNERPPEPTNQVVFLLILGGAVWGTIMPVSYALNARLATSLGTVGDLRRAVRQGMLASVLVQVLMVLQFMRVLNLFTGVMLVLVTMLLEALLALRRA
ncbi:MAG TPA: hypothetical protein GX702_15405 [Chloroflexi bacterium]|jgi:hypothetical protein|nr:hypothetical protein [Chloroflexota bacterium]